MQTDFMNLLSRADMNRLSTLKGNWLLLQFLALPLCICLFVSAGEYPYYTPGEIRFTAFFAAFNFVLFGALTFFPLFVSVVIDGVLYGATASASIWINLFALFEAISFGGTARYPGPQPAAFTAVAVFASFYHIASLAFVVLWLASKNHLMLTKEIAEPEQPFNQPIIGTSGEDSA